MKKKRIMGLNKSIVAKIIDKSYLNHIIGGGDGGVDKTKIERPDQDDPGDDNE